MGPAHVTLKLRRGLPRLRTPRCYRVLERAFRAGKEKPGFGLCQFSVQDDHLHLIVEADGRWDLTRGMQGLVIRIAKALNRHWGGRHGPVFAERYFSRALTKRNEIWRAFRYVLCNARKHGKWFSKTQPDPFSSGRWFTRWLNGSQIRRPLRDPPVRRSRDFLVSLILPIEIDAAPGTPSYGAWETTETFEELLARV